jgi:hypothetical protein
MKKAAWTPALATSQAIRKVQDSLRRTIELIPFHRTDTPNLLAIFRPCFLKK